MREMAKEMEPANGIELGQRALARAESHGIEICSYEKQRLALVNEAELTEHRAALRILSDEREDLRVALRSLQASIGGRARRWYYFITAAFLMIAGFSFSHLALSPFGLGWQAWPFAIGLTLVCAVLTDAVLERFGTVRIVGAVALAGLIIGLAGLITLAILRGEIVSLFLRAALSGSQAENGASILSGDAATFYAASIRKLQIFFALLAGALEVATGIMVWEARKISIMAESAVRGARTRLAEIEPEMIRRAREIIFLENEPAIFEQEFMSAFRRGLERTAETEHRNSLGRLFAVALLGLAVGQLVHSQTRIVIVPDLTNSANVRVVNGGTERDRNLGVASQMLSILPAGARFTVLGITGQSFARPSVLIEGNVPTDPGPLPFINRIEHARSRFAASLHTAGRVRAPDPDHSDVLGALVLAADILRESGARRKLLVVSSDMRQFATPLDIEHARVVRVPYALQVVNRDHLYADLRDVDVWVLGAHAAGKDIVYWRSPRDFWTAYFARCGARLRLFTTQSDISDVAMFLRQQT